MDIVVKPSKANGVITAPPSKSMAHRMLICAALSEGTSHITNIAYSQDILATLDCIRAMGASAKEGTSDVCIEGFGKNFKTENIEFPCRESGSTIRFFMAIGMIAGGTSVFYGSPTLLSRPFSVYEDICKAQNIEFKRESDKISITGKLKADDFCLPGDISSQFITGLLFVLPLLDKDSSIVFTTEVESRSYINLTLKAMEQFGVKAYWDGEGKLVIPGNQAYCSKDVAVEGDYSNAAFLDIYNFMGGNVKVEGLDADSLQGDRVYGELFEKLSRGKTTIDISDCPDLGPVLFACAALNHGAVFTGTRRLKIKESDRGTVMCKELEKFGVASRQEENEIEIYKCDIKAPSEDISGHNDHRIVMTFTTMLSVTGGKLTGAQAVSKSFPDYFDKMKSLGIEVTEYGMD